MCLRIACTNASGDGANVGYCSTVFAGALDEPHVVYSFEPEPRNFVALQDVVRRRHLEGRVLPFRMAVGAAEGSATLVINERHHGDHRLASDANRSGKQPGLTVPVIGLDAFVSSNKIHPICFIKVDVQGYELPVCYGMERTLAANPNCTVALEYDPVAMHEMGFDPTALMDWCDRQGFRVYSVKHNGQMTRGVVEHGRGYTDLILSRRDASKLI